MLQNDDVIEIASRYPELNIRLDHFSRVGRCFSSKGTTKKSMTMLKLRSVGLSSKLSGVASRATPLAKL